MCVCMLFSLYVLFVNEITAVFRPTERGGGGGISPGPGLIGGPEHLSMHCRYLYCKLLQSILYYQNA